MSSSIIICLCFFIWSILESYGRNTKIFLFSFWFKWKLWILLLRLTDLYLPSWIFRTSYNSDWLEAIYIQDKKWQNFKIEAWAIYRLQNTAAIWYRTLCNLWWKIIWWKVCHSDYVSTLCFTNIEDRWVILFQWKSTPTPARTHFISELKSRVLKFTFLAWNDGKKWSRLLPSAKKSAQ